MPKFEIPAELHRELNPKLWKNNSLKQPVVLALLKIAKEYYEFLDLPTPIVDIVVSGSQANYNYSQHSDIDLHIIMNYADVECDMPVDELFDTKRKLWKEQRNITIYGIPVEVYVEDTEKPAVSSTFSLLKEQWIKEPSQPVTDFDEERIVHIAAKWTKLIYAALKTRDLEQCRRVKSLLWGYRKLGLDKEGEMGTTNLVFKTLRNSGVTDMLLDTVRILDDKALSI